MIAIFIGICLSSASIASARRTITVVGDLDHKKGGIGSYRALVIGIQNYNDPKINDLEIPLKDARTMAEVLKNRYGFTVSVMLDAQATRRALYKALRKLASTAGKNDSVLIYYAGHGDLDRQYDDGWWIPVDATGGDSVTYFDNVQILLGLHRAPIVCAGAAGFSPKYHRCARPHRQSDFLLHILKAGRAQILAVKKADARFHGHLFAIITGDAVQYPGWSDRWYINLFHGKKIIQISIKQEFNPFVSVGFILCKRVVK